MFSAEIRFGGRLSDGVVLSERKEGRQSAPDHVSEENVRRSPGRGRNVCNGSVAYVANMNGHDPKGWLLSGRVCRTFVR